MGLNAHVRDKERGRFWPKPADVLFAVEGDDDAQARLAWSTVLNAIRHSGSWDSLRFEDKTVHMAIQSMGGWEPLALIDSDEVPFRAQEFRRLYAHLKRHPIDVPDHLVGRHERSNSEFGKEWPSVVVIRMPAAPVAQLPENVGAEVGG